MLSMQTSMATLMFRLPADKIGDAPKTDRDKPSFQLGNTLYVTYEEFLEATGLAATDPLPE